MKLDAPDREPSALVRRKSETSIEIVLHPHSLTQTSVVFPLEKKEEAMELALAWVMRREAPDKPEFRSVLGKKGRRGGIIEPVLKGDHTMTEFKQVGTATGRLSSRKSNLKTPEGARTGRATMGKPSFENVEKDAPFSVVKHAVAKQFELMKGHQLYRVDLSGPQGELLGSPEQRAAATGDRLWEKYLASFPEGTNPLYKERTDHDCSCCRHFVRTMGGVVVVVDGKLESIWDFRATDTFYDDVGEAMAEFVRTAAIDNIFLHTEKTVGTEKSFQQLLGADGKPEPGAVNTWEHFHLRLPNEAVVIKEQVGPRQSDARAAFDVLKRGLEELTLDAVDTVLELIAQNSLYKGEENKFAVSEFRKLKKEYAKLDVPTADPAVSEVARMWAAQRDVFCWQASQTLPPSVSRIRNTAIGTLLQDLSGSPSRTYEAGECVSTICPQRAFRHAHEGSGPLEMEDAVKKFEAMVAPSNYKRPTALVTKAMVEKARKAINELGYTSALERRYAVPEDVTVNNVLFADRSAKLHTGSRGGGKTLSAEQALTALAESLPEKPRSYDKVEEVSVEKFIKDVLPKATSLEVLFENRHVGSLVSLVAPVDPGAKGMFKWPNAFSWSYAGDFADAIKERVKRAGGSVTGDLCCRLAWDYEDDLDFHMQEPGATKALGGRLSSQGNHIYYGNVRRLSANGGMLDLDANGCDGMKSEPAENIFYADKAKMVEGVYELSVNNYSRRSDGKGFEAQVEFDGATHSFAYEKALRTGDTVMVAKIKYTRAAGFEIVESLPSMQSVKTVWGLETQRFHKASMAMLSPNYWDITQDDLEVGFRGFAGVGNKHWFFMLEGCVNDGTARPFYNEFLRAELEPHRKTMEMVGAKMKTEASERQLSGLGFSSTKRDSVTVRVKGAFERVLKVKF